MKKLLALLLALVMVLSMVACGAKTEPADKAEDAPAADAPAADAPAAPKEEDVALEFDAIAEVDDKTGGMLILQQWMDPININFYADYGSTGAANYWSCGPQLVVYKGGELYGLLLESWELDESGLVWTMKIRENAGWSDGTPITVDDIIFSMEYFRQDTFTDFIFQADTMYFTETPVYEKVDDYTYTITTTVPYPTVFDFYAVNCFIIPKHVFENVPAEEFHTTTVNSTPGEIVCGGPFKITEYKIGEYIKCERNEYFWDEVYLDELYWRIAADGNSMFTALQTGELDFTFLLGSKYQEAVDAGMQIARTNGANYSGISMNTQDPILSDVNIRKAFSHIYDQQLRIDQEWGGQGEVYNGLAANMRFEDLDACVAYEHDVDKAKALIEESGWTLNADGYYEKDGQILEVTFIYEAGYEDFTAMILQSMFEGTGVKFNIEGQEYSVLLDNVDAGNYQLASNYSSLGPDPANYYDNYLNSSLFSFYRSDVLDQAWIDGMTGATDEERQAAYSIVQHELTDAAVWLIQPRNWGYYAGNETCGLDEAMFTSTGMFVYFHKLYKIAE